MHNIYFDGQILTNFFQREREKKKRLQYWWKGKKLLKSHPVACSRFPMLKDYAIFAKHIKKNLISDLKLILLDFYQIESFSGDINKYLLFERNIEAENEDKIISDRQNRYQFQPNNARTRIENIFILNYTKEKSMRLETSSTGLNVAKCLISNNIWFKALDAFLANGMMVLSMKF